MQSEYHKMMQKSDPHNDGRALNLICYDQSKGKSIAGEISNNWKANFIAVWKC